MSDPTPDMAPKAAPKKRSARHKGVWLSVSLILLSLLIILGGLALTGKSLRLPVWAVAEVESRLNRTLKQNSGTTSVAVGGIEVLLDQDWVARLALKDVRLMQSGGTAFVTLPEVRATFETRSLLGGTLRPTSLNLIGGRLSVKRTADGRFDLDFGPTQSPEALASLSEILNVADAAFSSSSLSGLTRIEAEALTLTLTDAATGRQWQAGDGRLAFVNRPDEVAAELSFSLTVDQAAPARVVLTSVSQKRGSEARLAATVEGVAARDLAAQATPLAWLDVLDAPISGRLAATIDPQGQLGPLESTLEIAAGVLRPTEQTAPIAFDKAGLTLAYDPKLGRIELSRLVVESPSLRLSATGQSFLIDPQGAALSGSILGAVPAAFIAQVNFSEVMVDPDGLFELPMRFAEGALELRLSLDPFVIDIGQLTLTQAPRNLALKGRISADPSGWRVGLDVALNEIQSDQLISLWPVTLVAKTREWLSLNLLEGTLVDVKAAVRLVPGAEPKLSLGYEFEGTDVRFLKALPPIKSGSGYSTIEGQTYTLVLEKGIVTPEIGGDIDVSGTVFRIPDISKRPTFADITLVTKSSLVAALSLLDQPPFGFLTKANRPVDLGQGQAKLVAKLGFPLKPKVLIEDVSYTVTGEIANFRSEKLIAGRAVTSPLLHVTASAEGLGISGKGLLDTLPFDVTFQQAFGLAGKGRSSVVGKISVSDETLRDMGVRLPKGMISGEGPADITVDLTAEQPAQLALTTDLRGIGLSLPALGWTKPAGRQGRLTVAASLGKVPEIKSLEIDASGLKAKGVIVLQDGGGLDVAKFESVRLDDWLNASVSLTGRGAGRPVGVSVTSGAVDLRGLAVNSGGASGSGDGPLDVQLDRLTVSDGIALTGFRGEFSSRGGFNGGFTARVNDVAEVRGAVVPSAEGTAVRIQSDNAGRVMRAAGVFADARGGNLDLQLVPTGAKGEYRGRAKIGTIRVQNASVLAELLSAISVIGLLEQLNGSGLVFSQADVEFLLTPNAVEVTRGSAIGASLGVSMAGVYSSTSKQLAMQGVVSPIYLLNGIGSFLTRRGEGLFGFNYKIGGTADAPKVSVNPLSILTPGMFRDLFRKPAPVLPKGNG